MREHGEFDSLSLLSGFRAAVAWFCGVTDTAFHQARQAIEFAERTGSPFSRVYALSGLGLAHLAAGHPNEAREVLDEAVALCRGRQVMRMYLASLLGSLAESHLRTGDLECALALSEEGTAYALRAGTAVNGLHAERVVAATRIARGESREAAESLDRCDALVQSTHAAAYAPFIAELRARLAAAQGEDATELLQEAQRQFASVGASGHADRLARELGAQ